MHKPPEHMTGNLRTVINMSLMVGPLSEQPHKTVKMVTQLLAQKFLDAKRHAKNSNELSLIDNLYSSIVGGAE